AGRPVPAPAQGRAATHRTRRVARARFPPTPMNAPPTAPPPPPHRSPPRPRRRPRPPRATAPHPRRGSGLHPHACRPPALRPPPPPPAAPRRRLLPTLGIAALALAGMGLVLYAWQAPPFHGAIERTEDAQVQGQVTLVAPQVEGYVVEVAVQDFQQVRRGQLL